MTVQSPYPKSHGLPPPPPSSGTGRRAEAACEHEARSKHVTTAFLRRVAHDIASPTGVTMTVLDELAIGAKPELVAMARRGLKRLLRLSEQLAGTPAYLAPERAMGAPPDELADLYALGVLFYETLTGQVPFDGNVAQILNAHINQPPTPPSWRLPKGQLDERFDDLILACLAKDPAARLGSVRTFQQELAELMERLGMSKRRSLTPAPLPRQKPGDAATRAMVESNPLPMFSLDPDGNVTFVNDSFCLFVKKTAEELTGAPLGKTRLGAFCPGLVEDLQVVLEKNKVTSRELEFTLGDRLSKVLIWMAPLAVGGIIIGAHGVVHWIQK